MMDRHLTLLGPQHPTPTVGDLLRRVAPSGVVATITAGWQEREGEDDELQAQVGDRGRARNLALYRRAERVWREDPELRRGHRQLQQQIALLRQSYQVRLAHAMEAWMAVVAMPGNDAVLEPEREAALRAVQSLDAEHLERVEELRMSFAEAWRPSERPAIRRERVEIAADLEAARAVLVAGGHVAVLLNRIRLFDLSGLLDGKTIVAWSAGAMAMSNRVVLFHDTPPQGQGFAEAFDVGLGVAADIVPLPHADERLRLGDAVRVTALARRFAPSLCVALDAMEGVERAGPRWVPLAGQGSPLRGARRLHPDGSVRELAS